MCDSLSDGDSKWNGDGVGGVLGSKNGIFHFCIDWNFESGLKLCFLCLLMRFIHTCSDVFVFSFFAIVSIF